MDGISRIKLQDNKIVLTMPFPNMLPKEWGGRAITQLGSSYGTVWELPCLWSVTLAKRALGDKLSVAPELVTALTSPGEPDEHCLAHPSWKKLYPFQQLAVLRLIRTYGQLLALSPGLGKTACALTAAEILNSRNVLIVVPKPLIYVWLEEAWRWLVSPEVLSSLPKSGLPPRDGWFVTNYEQAVKHKDKLRSRHWDVLVMDESVKVKNRRTQRFTAMNIISKSARRVWCLSGNPVTRYADDLWTQFHLVKPTAFSNNTWSYWRFATSVCTVQQNPWAYGLVVTGTRPGINFAQDFADIMFVRHQREVLQDLPDMIFETIPLVLGEGQRKVYRQMLHEFKAELEGQEMTAANKVARLTRLQQIVSNTANLFPDQDISAKSDALVELLQDGTYELPAVVWVYWKPGAYALHRRLKEIGLRVGIATGDQDAAQEIEAYKAGQYDVLVLSLGVGKFGHTLINTKTFFYHDKSFDADAYYQSLGRGHRIGLIHRPVVVSLVAQNTVDKLVERNLADKMFTIAAVTNAELRELLSGLEG